MHFVVYKFNASIFFCLCFSLAIEVLWEIFEWGADNLFNQTMQGEKLPGVNQPLVGDTMLDLVCNTTGAAIFFFHFLIGKFSKKSLGINFIEKQLTKEEALMIADQQEQLKEQSNEPKTEQIDESTQIEKVEETPQEFEENKDIEAKSTVKKSQNIKRASSSVAKPKQTKSKTKTTEK